MKAILFIILIALAGSCRQQKEPQTNVVAEPAAIRGIGKIIPQKEIIDLSLPSSGTVQAIFVNDNDSVTAGTPILTLASPSEQQELELARIAVNTQAAKVRAQEAIVTEENARLRNKQTEYDRILRLYNEGAETGQVRENAKTDLEVQRTVTQRVDRELQSEKDKLAEARQNVNLKEAILNERTLLAPDAGKILEITIKRGEYVQEGNVIGQFQPDSPEIALCEVDELFANRVRPGQTAYLLSAGGVDTLGRGKVIFCANFLKKKSLFYEKAGEAEDRRVLEVKIMPDKPLPVLLNSKIECSIMP